ncbi:MAG: LysM peptidoglycan-binding domain-containing protein [Fuerstiella sp.]|nr:LysM peptidoglycan-binding domain-containing protein [Fuerstiella sp.]
MARSNKNSASSGAGRGTHQSTESLSQTSGGKVDQSVASDSDDWGYQPARDGMAIEVKLGLFIIVILLGAFGFLIYRNVDLHQQYLITGEVETPDKGTQLATKEHSHSIDVNQDKGDDSELQSEGQVSSSDDSPAEISMKIDNLTTETGELDEPAMFEFGQLTPEDTEQTVVSNDQFVNSREDTGQATANVDPLVVRNDTISGERLSHGNRTGPAEINGDEPSELWIDVAVPAVASGTANAADDDSTEFDSQTAGSELRDFTGASVPEEAQTPLVFGQADTVSDTSDEITDFNGSNFTETLEPVGDSFPAEDTNDWSVTDSDQSAFAEEDVQPDEAIRPDAGEALIVQDVRVDSESETDPKFPTVQESEYETVDAMRTSPRNTSFDRDSDRPVNDFSINDEARGFSEHAIDFDQESTPVLSFESESMPADLASESTTHDESSDTEIQNTSPFLDIPTPSLAENVSSSTNSADLPGDEIFLKEFAVDEGTGLRPVNPEYERRKKLSAVVAGNTEFNVNGFIYENRIVTASAKSDPYDICEVVPGDNYWNISQRVYGTSRYFSALALYNRHRIRDPKKLRPGMKVLVPPAEVLEEKYPDLFHDSRPVQQEPSGYFVRSDGRAAYRIGEHDTLSQIAQKHLGRSSRWIQIYRLNRTVLANPNKLTPGTVIALPDDATDLHMAP